MSSVHWLARCTCFGCSIGLLGAFATGCSDPVASPPQAAFEATFSGSSCAATVSPGPVISIGTASKNETATYADGTEGVSVACRVVAQGDNYYAKIKVSRGSTSLSFEATMPNDPTKTANAKSVALTGPNTAGTVYSQSATSPCTAQFYEGAPGRIKASFTCVGMVGGTSTASALCDVSGFVVGENCETE